MSKEFIIDGKCAIYNGDTVEVTSQMPRECFDMSINSLPFSNLYTYSDSIYDMGNTENDDEFFKQYEFLVKEKYRTHKDGAYTLEHCKDLPLYKGRDGASGLSDFTGRIIKVHEKYGFVYQGKYRVWKDPVIEMQRTKNHGLLHKNYTQRSEAVRQGMADYVLVFKKIDTSNEDYEIRLEYGKFGEDTVLRCCELWANKTDNILSRYHSIIDELDYIDYGFFEYWQFEINKKDICKKLKNGRNITIACRESSIVDSLQNKIGVFDNTIQLIEDMKIYNLIFHSRCYLTNGTELITFRKWNGDFEDCQVVRRLSDQVYIGKNAPKRPLVFLDKKDIVGYSIHCWQRYASPVWNDLDDLPHDNEWVWFDIQQTNVLNIKQSKDNKDEKHICPLQLDLIYKCVDKYSKVGDWCASFFGGIGSEPVTFLEMGRKAYAVELKSTYFNIMVKNIKDVLQRAKGLFD